jgi:hypothetical protein
MSESYKKSMSIADINKGAITDLFVIEYQKLLNNLADENCSWKAGREITIKLKVKLTSESRESATSSVEVNLKTAPPKPNESMISLDFDGKNVQAFSRQEEVQPDLENVTPFKAAGGDQ